MGLLSLCLVLCAVIGKAQNASDMTLVTSLEKGKPLVIELQFDGQIQVDWGDGDLKSYQASDVANAGGYIEGEVKGSTLVIHKAEGLRQIYLSMMGLTSIRCNRLTALQLLSATNNKITRVELVECPQLSDINLSRNALQEASFLQSIAPSLEELRISQNKLSELALANTPKLNYLDATNNEIKTLQLPTQSLKTLLVKGNKLAGEVDLSQQTGLVKLQLSKNSITALSLKTNPEIEILEVDNNQLVRLDLGALPNCKTIDLGQNQLDPCALWAIFKALPTIEKKAVGKDLLIKGNPNVQASHTQEAINKGWTPDVVGDNTGCTESIAPIDADASQWVYFATPDKMLISTTSAPLYITVWNALAQKALPRTLCQGALSLGTLPQGVYVVQVEHEQEMATLLIEINE